MRGVVQDATGKPLAGIQFACQGVWVADATAKLQGAKDAVELRMVHLLRHYQQFVNEQLVVRTTSGPDGAFALRFLDVPGRYSFGWLSGDAVGARVDFRPGDGVVVGGAR